MLLASHGIKMRKVIEAISISNGSLVSILNDQRNRVKFQIFDVVQQHS